MNLLEEFLVHLYFVQHNFVDKLSQWCPIKPIKLKGILEYESKWRKWNFYPRDVNNLSMS